MHPGPGFQVVHEITRADRDVVAGLAEFPAADVSDQLNRLFTMNVGIRPLTTVRHLAGSAVTVRVFPGDNLMVHKALDVIQPGDVIVVDAAASTLTAIVGDMIATKARHRGAVGIVVDGLVRDLAGIDALGDLPVFGRDVTPIGPLHRGPGEVNTPISCGGVVVSPGDVVIGDSDGVVVVRQAFAAPLLERLRAGQERAEAYAAAVARGEFSLAWVDDALRRGGVDPDLPGSPPGTPS